MNIIVSSIDSSVVDEQVGDADDCDIAGFKCSDLFFFKEKVADVVPSSYLRKRLQELPLFGICTFC
jgi:hypothetical protein